jgi:hypothetical protein
LALTIKPWDRYKSELRGKIIKTDIAGYNLFVYIALDIFVKVNLIKMPEAILKL